MMWDIISNPSHYTQGRKIQPIDVMESYGLGHHLACAVKYIARAGRKNSYLKDLKKAEWYLQRAEKLEDLSQLTVDFGEEVPEINEILWDWELSTNLAEALRNILLFACGEVESLSLAITRIQEMIDEKEKEEKMSYKFGLQALAIAGIAYLMTDPAFAVNIQALQQPIADLKSNVFSSWMVPVKVLGVAAAGAISFYKQSLVPFGMGIGTVLGISFFDSYLGNAAQGALI